MRHRKSAQHHFTRDVVDGDLRCLTPMGCAEGKVNRHKMLVCGMNPGRLRRTNAVIQHGLQITRLHLRFDPGAKGQHMRCSRAALAADIGEVMRHAAGPHQQHALLSQRGQSLADRIQLRGCGTGGQGNLDQRYIGLRVQMHHRHPGPMVKGALCIRLRWQACRSQQIQQVLRQFGTAGCRVLQGIQSGREPAKVVPCGRCRLGHDGKTCRHPMRRHEHNALQALRWRIGLRPCGQSRSTAA